MSTAEQIIEHLATLWYGCRFDCTAGEFAERVAENLRLAGIDLDHTYEQIGYGFNVKELRGYEGWKVWDYAVPGSEPVFVRRPLGGEG